MEQTQKPAPRNLQRQRREAIAVDKNGRAMAVYILTVYATVRYSLIFPIKAAANPYNLRERERGGEGGTVFEEREMFSESAGMCGA